jgi:ABC-type enterochelin transport system permease subunit
MPEAKRLFFLWTLAMDLKFKDLHEVLKSQGPELLSILAKSNDIYTSRMFYQTLYLYKILSPELISADKLKIINETMG